MVSTSYLINEEPTVIGRAAPNWLNSIQPGPIVTRVICDEGVPTRGFIRRHAIDRERVFRSDPRFGDLVDAIDFGDHRFGADEENLRRSVRCGDDIPNLHILSHFDRAVR